MSQLSDETLRLDSSTKCVRFREPSDGVAERKESPARREECDMLQQDWPGPCTSTGLCEGCGRGVGNYEQSIDARAVPDLALPLDDFVDAWLCSFCFYDPETYLRASARFSMEGSTSIPGR